MAATQVRVFFPDLPFDLIQELVEVPYPLYYFLAFLTILVVEVACFLACFEIEIALL